MTSTQLRELRQSLGLSAEAFARLLQVPGGSRTIYKWEHGENPIPGPIVVLLGLVERSPEAKALFLSTGN